MREFWDKVLYFREHLDELPPPKLKKTRKKKQVEPLPCEIEKKTRKKKQVEPLPCEIEPHPEEDVFHED